MKKYLCISLIYAVLAMIGGVFYREFTKFNNFTGVTALGKVHVHLFILGMIMFLIIALFAKTTDFSNNKLFKVFLWVYNIGLILTVSMLYVRGINEVLNTSLSKGANASISGIAGIGHMILGTGIILLLISLIKENKE